MDEARTTSGCWSSFVGWTALRPSELVFDDVETTRLTEPRLARTVCEVTGATNREQPKLLRGGRVVLEPLTRAHAESLFPSASDPEVWRWKLVPRPETVLEMEALIAEVMVGPGRWAFAISTADGRVIGSTTLARFDWTHRFAEMGFTWLSPDRWGQGFNEEAKLVLLGHCFEHVGLARVEFQVDEDNRRSVSALHRLGFTYEGRLRSRHLRPDGTRRNSLYFSVLADEWPGTAARLTDLIRRRGTARTVVP